METLLAVDNLKLRFEDQDPVLKGISFALNRGAALGLVGESGSGKSVTGLSIMGLLPQATKEGHIFWEPDTTRTDLAQLPEASARALRGRRIAMVFQEPMTALNPLLRCGAQLQEAMALYHNLNRKESREMAMHWMEKVRLGDPERIYRAFPHEISGGQKQRLLIAMALCGNPSLLIADEPTTALDTKVQAAILELLHELRQSAGAALLFISHDLGVVRQVADNVAVMKDGKIVESGRCQDILENPKHPYTQGLVRCRPSAQVRWERMPTLENPEPPKPLTGESVRIRHETLYSREPVLTATDIGLIVPLKGPFWKKKQTLTILQNISFDLYPDEILGVVGPSGSGKTSLGKVIAGIVSPSSGHIRQRNPGKGTIQMVFQDPYSSLNPRMTAGQMLVEVLSPFHPDSEEAARKLLEQVGLPRDFYKRYPAALSGGQRQRLSIARAIAGRPAILICDEVTSALDVSVQATILNLLKDIREELQIAMLFISHDPAVIHQMCDRTLVVG